MIWSVESMSSFLTRHKPSLPRGTQSHTHTQKHTHYTSIMATAAKWLVDSFDARIWIPGILRGHSG